MQRFMSEINTFCAKMPNETSHVLQTETIRIDLKNESNRICSNCESDNTNYLLHHYRKREEQRHLCKRKPEDGAKQEMDPSGVFEIVALTDLSATFKCCFRTYPTSLHPPVYLCTYGPEASTHLCRGYM